MPTEAQQLLFNTVAAKMTTSLTVSVTAATRVADELLAPDDRLAFMLAVLVRQTDLMHELISAILIEDPPRDQGRMRPEAKLLAATFAHLISHEAQKAKPPSDPRATLVLAKSYLQKLGHEVPTTVEWMDE